MNYCQAGECREKSVYFIEWWGLNQNRKDPEVVDEAYSCQRTSHIIKLSKHDEYGGPDAIYAINSPTKSLTGLLQEVQKELTGEKSNFSKFPYSDKLKQDHQLRLF